MTGDDDDQWDTRKAPARKPPRTKPAPAPAAAPLPSKPSASKPAPPEAAPQPPPPPAPAPPVFVSEEQATWTPAETIAPRPVRRAPAWLTAVRPASVLAGAGTLAALTLAGLAWINAPRASPSAQTASAPLPVVAVIALPPGDADPIEEVCRKAGVPADLCDLSRRCATEAAGGAPQPGGGRVVRLILRRAGEGCPGVSH